MKHVFDNFPTAGKRNSGYIQDENQSPNLFVPEGFRFDPKPFEKAERHLIGPGRRTGHYFVKTESDWFRDVESVSRKDSTYSSFPASRLGSDHQISKWVSRPSLGQQRITEEPQMPKPSELLLQFNVEEKIKQERERELKRQSDPNKIFTDSTMREINDQFVPVQPVPFQPLQQFQTPASEVHNDSLYSILQNLPFQTPSKMSEFSGAFSRSKANITFSSKWHDSIAEVPLLVGMPPLDPSSESRDRAIYDHFFKPTHGFKSILLRMTDDGPLKEVIPRQPTRDVPAHLKHFERAKLIDEGPRQAEEFDVFESLRNNNNNPAPKPKAPRKRRAKSVKVVEEPRVEEPRVEDPRSPQTANFTFLQASQPPTTAMDEEIIETKKKPPVDTKKKPPARRPKQATTQRAKSVGVEREVVTQRLLNKEARPYIDFFKFTLMYDQPVKRTQRTKVAV